MSRRLVPRGRKGWARRARLNFGRRPNSRRRGAGRWSPLVFWNKIDLIDLPIPGKAQGATTSLGPELEGHLCSPVQLRRRCIESRAPRAATNEPHSVLKRKVTQSLR